MISLFCIRDKKADIFFNPLSHESTANAVRFAHELANDGKSFFFKFPEDYSLYRVADFDPVKGEVIGFAVPVFIEEFSNLKQDVKNG